MRFKLDENLNVQAAEILRDAGHEADTVVEEGLGGESDPSVLTACKRDGRCLVTLDMDFADPFAYPPQDCQGIIVLRHPRLRQAAVLELVRQVVCEVQTHSPVGELWIAEPGRIRVHTPAE